MIVNRYHGPDLIPLLQGLARFFWHMCIVWGAASTSGRQLKWHHFCIQMCNEKVMSSKMATGKGSCTSHLECMVEKLTLTTYIGLICKTLSFSKLSHQSKSPRFRFTIHGNAGFVQNAQQYLARFVDSWLSKCATDTWMTFLRHKGGLLAMKT